MFVEGATLAPSSPTIPTSVGLAILSAYSLDLLKRMKQVPMVSYYSTHLNTVLRIIMAGIGTLGVSWQWSPAGEGHQLLITIPATAVLLSGLWHWAVQYGMQHVAEIQLAQRSVGLAAIQSQTVDAKDKATIEQK